MLQVWVAMRLIAALLGANPQDLVCWDNTEFTDAPHVCEWSQYSSDQPGGLYAVVWVDEEGASPQDGVFVCEGVDLEASPYKDVNVDLKYDVKQWNDEVEKWTAAQLYTVDAEQIKALDLLLERLQDTVDAGDKLPDRLIGPAAVLLERPSCAL